MANNNAVAVKVLSPPLNWDKDAGRFPVGKFTNMIREFSNNSQFIIVTHNKMTMSTVDVIYGVTMQEPGVSKLVTVDFRNLTEN